VQLYTEKASVRIRSVRFAYGLLTAGYLVCMILQVFFAGLGLFVNTDDLQLHRMYIRELFRVWIDPHIPAIVFRPNPGRTAMVDSWIVRAHVITAFDDPNFLRLSPGASYG
ncbi:MAG: hypothetical protein K0Q73_8779, partial [Paenibacillus sp.]|nr:hypothetical protein [Paenibacillus sp.]